jgi:hypothetical protein
MEMVESVASTVASGLSEQGVVIIVGSNTPASDDRIAAALSLLEEEAVRQRFVIRAIGVIVGDFESDEVVTVRSSSGRGVYLRVSGDDLKAPYLVTALLHHVQGEVVIAR